MTTRVAGDGNAIRIGDVDEFSEVFWDKSANALIIQSPTSTTSNTPLDRITISHTETVINENGDDRDFRVEGDTETNMFVVDASVDAIGIGTATPSTDTLLNIYRNDTATTATLRLEQDSTGDAVQEFLLTGGAEWAMGIDNSSSDTFVISAGGDLGTGDEDALRITDAAPPVITYNATHPTGTFDYVCESCGEHRSDSFVCHGLTAPWHDDVEALGLALRDMPHNLQESPAMQHLADIGVLEMKVNDDGFPWTGINMAAAQWFTWSGMHQMHKRIETLEERVLAA